MNRTWGNTTIIKAYAANLYLEEKKDPEHCNQKNKFSFSIVRLYSPIKAFFSCNSQKALKANDKKRAIKGAVETQTKSEELQ